MAACGRIDYAGVSSSGCKPEQADAEWLNFGGTRGAIPDLVDEEWLFIQPFLAGTAEVQTQVEDGVCKILRDFEDDARLAVRF